MKKIKKDTLVCKIAIFNTVNNTANDQSHNNIFLESSYNSLECFPSKTFHVRIHHIILQHQFIAYHRLCSPHSEHLKNLKYVANMEKATTTEPLEMNFTVEIHFHIKRLIFLHFSNSYQT